MRQIAYGGGQMERREHVIYSSHLKKDMHIIQYGHSGLPFLGFPTQCAPCTNYEDFGVTRVLGTYLEDGQMQLFCVETVDGESWCCNDGINTWRSARQESYHRFIVDEVIPLIRKFSPQGIRPFVMGIDMGATQAAISFFRRPELFCGILALSGIYDSSVYYHGWMNSTLYDNSVECFLANMPEDHPWIREYNSSIILMCCGKGAWEDECCRTLKNLERILHRKRINAMIEYWGEDVSHDWVWWKYQLEYFIPIVIREHQLVTSS